MSVQPIEHSSIARNQLPATMSTIGEEKKTLLPTSQQARMDAVVPRKQELCGAILYGSNDKRKRANPAGTDACSVSVVNCPVDLTKVR
jgi:hypothetical protein